MSTTNNSVELEKWILLSINEASNDRWKKEFIYFSATLATKKLKISTKKTSSSHVTYGIKFFFGKFQN